MNTKLLILHTFRRCPFAIRVRVTLEEKNLEYQMIEEKLSAKSTDLLKLHPEGRVPLLIHGGQVIHESSIITEYIDDFFPNPPLRPIDPLERAQLRMLTYWCDRTFKLDLDIFKYQWQMLSETERSELKSRLQKHLLKLDELLGSAPFLMGAEFSLADIHVFPFFRQLQKAHPDFSTLFVQGNLNSWLLRITERPSFIRAMNKVK